jgi:phosphoribosylanthranilate isomerase
VQPEIKFCGMTRTQDVEAAVALGARYVGVILAGGPRAVTLERARELVRRVPRGVGRVGVFGRNLEPEAAADLARAASLDVMQLHGDPGVAEVERIRAAFSGAVWAALRVREELPGVAAALFRVADAVVLDAYSPATLGGTGIALPWSALTESVEAVRGTGKLVLAGGLRPDTVADAIRALRPDIVDVSSGVELAPGVKDHTKLRAFRDAVSAEAARA